MNFYVNNVLEKKHMNHTNKLIKLSEYYPYIKTTINGQTIHNRNIKFKVLDRIKFNFNHHYFVKDDSIENNYLYITSKFKHPTSIILFCK